MKKLIPALCMLLVAACLMGTSTYAWFAANADVSATGMSVQAAADGGLAIASYKVASGNVPQYPSTTDFAASKGAIWSNQLDNNGNQLTNATVAPISTFNNSWWTGKSKDADSSAVNGNYTPVTVDAANYGSELKGYALMTSWVVKSLDQTGATYTLRVSSIGLDTDAEETTYSEALNSSLRIAIAVTDINNAQTGATTGTTAWYYFAPFKEVGEGADALESADFTYVTSATTTGKFTDANLKLGEITGDGIAIATGLDTTGVKVDVYVYYDGEDPECKSSNIALNVDKLALKINYKATNKAAASN